MPTKQYVKKLNGYYVKDEEARVRVIPEETVATMVANSTLSKGDRVKTSGYYAAGDGGDAEYVISTIAANNDGSIELDSGLYAKIITDEGYINIKKFGAKGDGTTDDTAAIQAAIDFSLSSGIKVVYVPAGTFATYGPLYLKEYCELRGENYNTSIIEKKNNEIGSVEGLQFDAIVIMTDSTFDTSTELSNDKAMKESINNITLRGNISEYVEGKEPVDRQYAIYSITNIPKAHIKDINIEYVDVGIDVKRLWTGYIKNIPTCRAFYIGVRINNESQGTIIENINILNTSLHGLYVAGGTYGSIRGVLVEYPRGGNAFYLDNWHGELIGCGTELGTGANVAFRAILSKVTISGAYVDTTAYEAADNRVISVQTSDVRIKESAIGRYSGGTTYPGKFATVYSGSLVIEDSNKILCDFDSDISTSGGVAFVTVGGKTYDVARGTIMIPSPIRTDAEEYDYIDSKINPSTKHKRSDIYMDNITYPYENTANGSNSYGPAYAKGDVGIIKNPLVSGHVGWFCNRDNKTDNPQSVGTITAITGDNNHIIELTTLELENYSTQGIRFFNHCNIVGVTSGATAEVSRVEPSVNKLVLTGISGAFVTGEKVRLAPNDFWRYADYLYIPFIHAGYTTERPTVNLVIGQQYYDRTLNKPIWYKGDNKWVDATGTEV